MGQSPSQLRSTGEYQTVQELPVGNIVQEMKTSNLLFLKQYSYTAQEPYQEALSHYAEKLSQKHEHILNFQHFSTKSENSFCSTFHKIVLIFEYVEYSLAQQINTRAQEHRPFVEKQMWSILCSAVLAAVQIIRWDPKYNFSLAPQDIRLTENGCVKLLSPEMIGISSHHKNQIPYNTPKSLGISIVECFLLDSISNQDSSFLESLIMGRLECSQDMKEILLMMVEGKSSFLEVEEHLFRLVQEQDSLASHSATPVLKSQQKNPPAVEYHCPKIERNNNEHKKKLKLTATHEELPVSYHDTQDIPSGHEYVFAEMDCENPDETDENNSQNQDNNYENQEQSEGFTTGNNTNRQSSHQQQDINSFILKEKKQQKSPLYDYEALQKVERIQHSEKVERRVKEDKSQILESKDESKGENLFTDPKLFSLIKNDLEEIKMRKSIGSVEQASEKARSESSPRKEETILTAPMTNQTSFNYSYQPSTKQENIRHLSHVPYNMTMIRENSQEYREEESDQRERQKISLRQHYKEVKNILDDTSNMGFKKTKRSEQTEIEKMKESSHQQHSYVTHERKLEQYLLRDSVQSQISEHREEKHLKDNHLQLFNQNSNASSEKSSRSNAKDTNQQDLVHVSENYTRGRYEGTKLNGKRHGYGTFFYSEGGKYVGEWLENKMHGEGTLYYPSQKVAYKGQWENDQLSGHGVLYNEEVTVLRTPYDYRDWQNVQQYWIKYEGQFKNDNKEGEGKLYLSNGERLDAHFRNDKVDGQGVLYRAQGKRVKGKWRENTLINLF